MSRTRPEDTPRDTLLITEPNSADAETIRAALGGDYCLLWARSGSEALSMLDPRHHAALLTAYNLPDMSGLDLRRQISAKHRNLPVILTCSEREATALAACLGDSDPDYLIKSPAAMRAWPQILRHVLRRADLLRENRWLTKVVESVSDCVLTTDCQGRILSTNVAAEPVFGYAPPQLQHEALTLLFPPGLPGNDISQIIAHVTTAGTWHGTLTGRRSDGSPFPVQVASVMLHNEDDEPARMVFIARDVTEHRDLLEKLRHLSVTDELTGLFNYRFFRECLRYEFRRARRYQKPLSCIMLDIDHFKQINDTFGHLAGDQTLQRLAATISRATREVDICARYGGDEFVILLPETPHAGAMQCALNLRKNIEEIRLPHSEVGVTASIGVATLDPLTDSEEELLHQADKALLMAKQRGRNNICTWHEIQEGMLLQVKEEAAGVTSLRESLRRLNHTAKAGTLESARPLLHAATRKIPHAHGHACNVSALATRLALYAGLPQPLVEAIRYAGLLHDMGNIAIRGDVWRKTGPLTEEEMSAIREHPIVSESIASELTFLETELPIIRHHHERYDGNGYPDGLAGEAIPIGARILAIADAFDAMTSDRPYRKAMAPDMALAELERHAGTQFDPALVTAFLALQHETACAANAAR